MPRARQTSAMACSSSAAMMVPVGRLVVLRTVPKSELVAAMAYLTIPALIGPLIGPPLGGFIVTYFSWRWIFLINIPIGILGLLLALRYVPNVRESREEPLDLTGFAIVSLGLAGGPYAGAVQVLMVAYTATLIVTVLSVSRLFTARLVSEREASRQSEVVGLLLRDFEESSADVLWEIDRQGRFAQPSLRLAELFERPVTRLAQLHLMTALRSMQQEGSGGVDRLQACFDRGEAFRDQVVRVNTKAGVRWWSITAKPVLAEMGQTMGWRGVLADVTNERQSHQHLAYLAHFDSLTGLANRVSVRNRLVQVFEGQSTQPRRAALMCMDLDNFKAINDTHGHSFGDAVLQEMARRLRGQMRKRDLCGRLGGDEGSGHRASRELSARTTGSSRRRRRAPARRG